jgi:Lipocalin-like domain
MSGARTMSARGLMLVVALAFSIFAHAQSARKVASSGGAEEKLIGAWHLVHIDAPGPDGKSMPVPQPKGMLVYTRDGHMSVQLMYPESAKALSNEYVLNGYEASFGSYDVDETAHTVTHHVQGSITRDLLVGKDLPRKFEFTADGRLIIRSARPDEHWYVTWERY